MLNAELEERVKKRVEKRAVKFTAGFDTRTKKLCDRNNDTYSSTNEKPTIIRVS